VRFQTSKDFDRERERERTAKERHKQTEETFLAFCVKELRSIFASVLFRVYGLGIEEHVSLSKQTPTKKRRMAFASSAAKPSSVSSSSAFAPGEIEGGGEQEILLLNKRNTQLLRNRERRERLCNIQKNILAVLILSGAMFLILNVCVKMKEEIKARG